MDDRPHILLADYVPMANKGEEAIVRGMEDMLSEGRPVALGLFDNVPQVVQRENITIFPRRWLFRFEGNSTRPAGERVLVQMKIALQLRAGIYGPLKNLTFAGEARCKPLREFFERAQYVLVGHDGVFCVESCGIIHLAKQRGKRVGIVGASAGIAGGRLYKAWLYRRAMAESDFCIFREEYSCESMKRVCRDPAKLMIGPDPAFAMRPALPDEARQVLEQHEPYRKAKQDDRPVVAVTALEKGRVYAGFRPDLQGRDKQQAHAKYLATILDSLVEEDRAFVLFLPHSMEDSGNDVAAARHVVEQMRASPRDAMILERDCDARLLKSIVGECDFLVGERTHSLIAGVSVGTPFAGLTNRRDTRTHGIIGQMCRCDDRIIDMDGASEADASRRILKLFQNREAIRQSLERTGRQISKQLEDMTRAIKGQSGGTT